MSYFSRLCAAPFYSQLKAHWAFGVASRIIQTALILVFALSTNLAHSTDNDSTELSDHRAKSLEIYRTIVEIPTVAGRGNGQKIVDYLSQQFIAAGFQAADINTVKVGDAVGLTVRYSGQKGSQLQPILLLGHMDVVEALDSDWQRPPFTLSEDDAYFYGRGSKDNKYGVSMLASTFVRLKKQGFVPNRDMYLVFSGDEETTMETTEVLAYKTPYLSKAEYALNSDAGGGLLDTHHQPISFAVQAAEKTYATFEITIRNPGGHSSIPRPDNAIYELSKALDAIANFTFPVNSSSVTRDYFRLNSLRVEGELGEAMARFAEDPTDVEAVALMSKKANYNGMLRTNCVATMLRGGHAENALPQSATATVNCRIFPGESIEGVKQQLTAVINNPDAQIDLLVPYPESPTSELRDDVMAAVRKAVDTISPDLPLVPYMSPGASDGMHFRKAGIPVWGVSSAFIRAEDNFAHGLNERFPKKSFNEGLEFWTLLLKELTQTN